MGEIKNRQRRDQERFAEFGIDAPKGNLGRFSISRCDVVNALLTRLNRHRGAPLKLLGLSF